LQLVKKFPAFHRTRRFITALTSVRHLSLSWANPIQSIYPHHTSWRSILMLSTHLRLGLPSGNIVSSPEQASRMWVFLNKVFYREGLLSPRPTPKLEDHPSSAVRDCFFNLFAAIILIGGRSSIRNLRTHHAVVTGTHYVASLLLHQLNPHFLNYISILCFSCMFRCISYRLQREITYSLPKTIFLYAVITYGTAVFAQ